MIRSFRHRGLQRLYERNDGSRIHPAQLAKVTRILTALDVATTAADLDLPGWRLHRLRGKLRDHYAVSVTGNWRIVFTFVGEPADVDLVDYH